MENRKLRQKLNKKLKGGVQMKDALKIIRGIDRLKDNPFLPDEMFLQKSLEEYGFITFMVFVCPKMRSKYLEGNQKEKYMPLVEPENGLFFPRIRKLQTLVSELWEVGVPSKLIVIVGDNGFDTYKGPPQGIMLNQETLNIRREQYLEDLRKQLSRFFPQLIEVESLGLMGIEFFEGNVEIPKDMLEREISFQQWTFEKYYAGKVPSSDVLEEIATLKIRAYAEQGFLIEAANAILVGTEGTNLDSWVQRTLMFQVAGARFPSIYPYIRKEILEG